jgi:hypothetical protein
VRTVHSSLKAAAFLFAALVVLAATVIVPSRQSGALEVDLNFAPMVFDYSNHTNISPGTPDCEVSGDPCVGMATGDIVRFNSVATVEGNVIDAVVTTVSNTSSSVTRYEVSSSWTTGNEYFRVRQAITAGGMTSYRFDFYLGGTYTGPGTGTPVTIKNAQLTALEIDNRQWVEFSDFDGFTLTSDSELTFQPNLLGSYPIVGGGRFQSSNLNGDLDSAPFQVVVTYARLQSVTVGFGRQTSADTNNFALAFAALPFTGHSTIDYGEVVAETPDPIDEGTPVPEIGFHTEPPTEPTVWTVPPQCGVFESADTNFTSQLSGYLQAGTYVTHCSGGSADSFVPLAYRDGVLEVNAGGAPKFTG